MTAVIYARYSTDSQREESIEGQIRECTAYAEKNGFTGVKHYIDRAISAKTDNRPQFQQMIKDSERDIFDVIIVWKLDRFARNRYDSARYKTQLKRNGVKLVSATEVISTGPEGIILESVLEGYAEYYSADLSEKVVRGMTDNYKEGTETVAFGEAVKAEKSSDMSARCAPNLERQIVRFDVIFYVGKRLHTFCTLFAHSPNSGSFCARCAQPAFLCIKRREFRRTRLSSTLSVPLHPSAGWLQGSPCP